ncbi:LacI family DNA-binding transcriptional regulator [Glycomyces salinus]|uniref:LacI family DNA-binding transcriptional regulator n=1 Tax=Glycomyces salinus TaxID=980294 RepID=UPI0018EA6857|nr:LacI family DNA-binding transcriptional regulator [Glycomyces salinus]
MTEQSPTRPATLADVAKLAGVSVPTASRVLNGGVRGAGGREEMRKRVEDAAVRLGYAASSAAQAIKGGRAKTIGLLVSDIEDFGSATMIAGMMRAAEARGLSVAVRATGDDADREADLLTRFRGERHRAIILATSRTTDTERESALGEQLEVLRDQGARIVLVGDSELDYPQVTVDNRAAAATLARELARAGHRRFAVVSGPEEQITSRDRVEGFLNGLLENGVAVDPAAVVRTGFNRDGGYAAVDALEDRLGGLDVIAAMSDAMAVGAIARLRERGLEVPRDIEVTGFDHVPMLGDVLPDFSTVEVPLREFGEAALRVAFDEPEAGGGRKVTLAASLIVHGARVGSAA